MGGSLRVRGLRWVVLPGLLLGRGVRWDEKQRIAVGAAGGLETGSDLSGTLWKAPGRRPARLSEDLAQRTGVVGACGDDCSPSRGVAPCTALALGMEARRGKTRRRTRRGLMRSTRARACLRGNARSIARGWRMPKPYFQCDVKRSITPGRSCQTMLHLLETSSTTRRNLRRVNKPISALRRVFALPPPGSLP